ncbi:MAG: Gfo/Idh/MocA family oxidoreductase [Verrucomicrobiota bacterium]
MTSPREGIVAPPPPNPIDPPSVDYLPGTPKWKPSIGLIGAGGITERHLDAYRAMNLDVVAIANRSLEKAEARCKAYFPEAQAYADYARLLAREDIEVVDIALPPGPRVAAIEAAIGAGKHILSQKPFAEDLATARRLCDLAENAGITMAVNQNGRWAPHYRWALQAVHNGHLGRLSSADFNYQWDHSWTVDTPFNEIHHLLLHDFGIHWFDFVSAFAGNRVLKNVFASAECTDYQSAKPPFLAHAVIDFEGFQARVSFNANVTHAPRDSFTICGEHGVIRSQGASMKKHEQTILTTALGESHIPLEGDWTSNGFRGTMAELLMAIAEEREPENSARRNLRSLELCFRAVECAS